MILISAVAFLLIAGTQGAPTQAGRVEGSIDTNTDGSVTLIASVYGGIPTANNFTWTLPDGSSLGATESTEDFQAFMALPSDGDSSGPSSYHQLVVKNGYTDQPQTITFRAEAGWWATFTYYLPAVPSNTEASLYRETEYNSDGSLTLSVTVSGGDPAPNSFIWTLPDGSSLSPGQSRGYYRAYYYRTNEDGSKKYRLYMAHGLTSSIQTITFTCSAIDSWQTYTTFTLPSQTTATESNVQSTLYSNTEYNSDGSITLSVTVSGGNPAPTSFIWTLPDGSSLSPGQTSGSFRAYYPRANTDGSNTYRLHMANGLTTLSQSVTFTVTAVDSWHRQMTFNLPAETQANVAGSVTGNMEVDSNKVITVVAEVVGGHPDSTNYVWTVQQPDGSYVDYLAGTGPSTSVTTNTNGNPTTTLTISALSTRGRSFKLYVTSETDGFVNWWASRTWSVSSTA